MRLHRGCITLAAPFDGMQKNFTLSLVFVLTMLHYEFTLVQTRLKMTKEKQSAPPKTSTERQKEYKARKLADGFKHTSIWIHTETEQEGRQAALDGKPLKPQGSKDPISWAIGWLNEKGKQ